MRLVNTTTRQVHALNDASSTPLYAALSHCWETDEVLFNDLIDLDSASQKAGFPKLHGACLVASNLGVQWLWADTVCIDRSSSAELTEAINSNFRWYRDCQFCIVYLGDLDHAEDAQLTHSQLRRCRWMQRSWTLQELIAPKAVLFYNNQWVQIGTKESLLPLLSDITRVDEAVLDDVECLSDFSIGRKMSWAAGRSASRVEDVAYSLLGIFGVSMPILYGEGKKAFLRLQEEILKDTDDATLFAWQTTSNQQYRGLFAISPLEFSHFATRSMTAPLRIQGDVYTSSAGIVIESVFGISGAGQYMVLAVSGGNNPEDGLCLGILFRDRDGQFVRATPQLTLTLPKLPKGMTTKILVKRDVDSRISGIIAKDLARAREQHCSLGTSEGATMTKRAGSGENLTYPSLSTLSQSPAAKSRSLDQLFHTHDTKSEYTDIAWSTAGSHFTDGKALPCGLGLVCSGNLENSAFGNQRHSTVSQGQPCDKPESRCGSNNEDEPPSSSVSHDVAPNCDDSADDVMDLFASLPPDLPKLDPKHAFAEIKDELASSALAEFSICITRSPPCTGKRARRTGRPPTRKRLKSASDAHIEVEQLTDSEDEGTVVVGYRRLRTTPAFACPYYTQSPQSHRTCLTRVDLRDVRDVKQHLWAAHRRPYSCPICRKTFATAGTCDRHVRAQSCALQTEPDIEGISWDQMRLLARRSDPELSADEHWFAVWDVLFPGTERPARARLFGGVESVVCVLRDYWARNGQQVVAEFLEGKGLRDYDKVQDEERGLAALYAAVLEQMVDEVVAGFPGG